MEVETRSAASPSRLSLINDSNLSDTELFYLRKLYSQRSGHSAITVLLEHLCGWYGLTFTDKTLLNAALAYSSQECPRWLLDPPPTIYWQFLARFKHYIRLAIQKNELTECHLIAAYVVLSTPTMQLRYREREAHILGFIGILRTLSKTGQSAETFIRGHCKLSYLYRHLVSICFCSPYIFLGPSAHGSNYRLLYKLLSATQTLPIPTTLVDPRATHGFPAQFWKTQLCEPNWFHLSASLESDASALQFAFSQLFCSDPWILEDACHKPPLRPDRLIETVEMNVRDALSLPYVTKFLDGVPEEESVSTVRTSNEKPHFSCSRSNGFTLFLAHLRRTRALLAIVNRLRGARAESASLIIRQRLPALVAEDMYYKRLRLEALALLLTPLFIQDHGGRSPKLYSELMLRDDGSSKSTVD
jgi:hypothetical protein